jgi:hypothetical protein
MTISPTSHSYPFLAVGMMASKVFTVTNASGTGPTGPILVTFSGSGSSAYSASENTCAGLALPGGQSCTFKVTFTPTGGTQNATVIASATPGGAPSAELYGMSSF